MNEGGTSGRGSIFLFKMITNMNTNIETEKIILKIFFSEAEIIFSLCTHKAAL
jgi:hypothetical protein